MKNIIRKTVTLGFSAVFLLVGSFGFGAQTVQASASLNSHPNDYETVRVSNYTAHPGSSSCWSTSIPGTSQNGCSNPTLNPGDQVSVTIYYHNNGSSDAQNLNVRITSGSTYGASTNHTFTGGVYATGVASALGSASVQLSESQSLQFVPGSVKWYPNQQSNASPLPSSEQNIFNGGLNLGTITPGWSTQGSVVLRFQVSDDNQSQEPVVVTGNTSSEDVNDVTLHGTIQNFNQASQVWFEYDDDLNGSFAYQTTIQSIGGSNNTQSFNHEAAMFGGFDENTTYYYRACGRLYGINGSQDVCGDVETFSLTNESSPQCDDGIDNDGDGYIDYPEDPACSSYSDNNESPYNYGNVEPVADTQNPDEVEENSAELNGTVDMNDFNNGIVFFVYGQDQNDVSDVEYDYNEYSDANSNEVSDQFEVVLIDNDHDGDSSFSYDVNGLDSDEEYFYQICVEFINDNGDEELECGGVENFFTDDENNNDELDVHTFTPDDVDSNSARLRGRVDEIGDESVYRYFEWGPNTNMNEELVVSGSTGSTGDFSRVLHGLDSDTTYYYRACAEEVDGGDDDCGVRRSFRTDDGNSESNLFALTTQASGVSRTTAILNGLALSSDADIREMWFEWGTSSGLNQETSHTVINASGTRTLARSISGLTANTVYYYRVVAEDENGNVARGAIQNFRTDSNPIVIVDPKDPDPEIEIVNGAGSLFLALDIEPDFENVIVGDTIDYTVEYRNIADTDLEDVVIQVIFAEETRFVKSTAGFYSSADHNLTVVVGDLDEDEEGSFVVRVEVLRGASGDLIVAQANAGHDHPSIRDAQVGTVPAYAINNVVNDPNRLVGLALFGGGFFPTTFLGWLILLLVLVALILLARKLYTDYEDKKHKNLQIG